MNKKESKKIIWMTWKDLKHPEAGGAEVVNEELAKRLVKNGHQVIFLVSEFPNCEKEEMVNGYKVIRVGGRYTVYLRAMIYYLKNLKNWADLIVDENNTVPFFAKFYSKKPTILLTHQLAREVWFYQMVFPLSLFGYLLEPVYVWLLRKSKVITISESTRKDLLKYGYDKKNIGIISMGIQILRIDNLEDIKKYEKPTMLSLGSIRKMKRTDQQIKAFEIAKKQIPNLQLKIAGLANDNYGRGVLQMIKKSGYEEDIDYLGRVNNEKKIELMQKSHLIVVTSLKEGWGLIVTEANSQGTPAVVYDVDGLRDSVRNNKTGLITEENNSENLAEKIVSLLKSQREYDKLRKVAWKWSREVNFDKCYRDFLEIIQ